MTGSKDRRLGRRQFLLTTTLWTATQGRPTLAGGQVDGVMLRPSGENDLYRVRIEMNAEGNVNVPGNPLVSRRSKQKLPIKSDAVFDYEERLRRPAGADASSVVTFAERYYHEAKNSSRLNRSHREIRLRESVRETIVRREVLPEVIYATDDYFTHDELELLRLPASSVAVDLLLPGEAVQVGRKYMPTGDALVSVLNLTSVEASDVEAEIVSITEADAKIHFRGQVDGSVDGVPTVIRTIGKLVFDRVMGTCTWLAMAVHETREIGIAEPGFDVTATIKMLRAPLSKTIALGAEPKSWSITAPIPADRLYVELRSDEVGFAVLMDRRWRMMSDLPGAAMMRMIDSDRSIAQCDFRLLASLEAGSQWTLEALQQDVKRTLGEQLGELIEVDQRVSDGGLRVLRVTAHGAVQGVPIQWIIMHFSDDSGRRLLATFTMEGNQIAEFAGSDLQLANSLRLIDRAQVQQSASAQPDSDPTARTANVGENLENEVQSASDVR